MTKIVKVTMPDNTAMTVHAHSASGAVWEVKTSPQIRDEVFELLQLGLHARELDDHLQRSADANRQREVAKAIDELEDVNAKARRVVEFAALDAGLRPGLGDRVVVSDDDWLRMRARASARAAADHASGKVADTGRRGGTQDLFDQTIFDRVLGWFRR